MKKLMFALVAGACATVMADEIASANVVGYQNKNTPQATWQIGTAPFKTTDGTMNIQKLLTGLTPITIDWDDVDGSLKTAAQLQVWNGTGYDRCYYVSNAYKDDGSEEGLEIQGWCDAEGNLRETYEFTQGSGYWVKNVPDSNPLTLSGQINDANIVALPCPTGWTIAGNAYPINISLNSKDQMKSDDVTPVTIDWENVDASLKTATQMQVWNGTGYDRCYYVSNAYKDDGSEEGLEIEGWCDAEGNLREGYVIPSGNGFWIKGVSGAFTLDFINPIK